MECITKEESYADRRQLFKNVWDTAMLIEEKDVDNIMAKPKVIKTQRLDDENKCAADRRKKQRIRNLRTVCRKILELCDRQDTQNGEGGKRLQYRRLDLKRIKTRFRKKKVKKNSLLEPQSITSAGSNDTPKEMNKSEYHTPATAKTFIPRTLVTHRRTSKVKTDLDTENNNAPGKGNATRRKITIKTLKRKKLTVQKLSPPGPSGFPSDCPDP